MLFERYRARRSLIFRADGRRPGGRLLRHANGVNHPARTYPYETSENTEKCPAPRRHRALPRPERA
ncbi:hypothetical protein SBD_4950 [Streptomyces bottropensis ATCC 25435]|uniref:Uncharacterized protein n=1 Tax=Streptomyces bottropensis ATCC 25435 TaxID=1054862 RepID=M3FKE0_9ACTN|nr:hypothetical protein SBD_4950 [Streptomyces bottropensis ATCC 25435]